MLNFLSNNDKLSRNKHKPEGRKKMCMKIRELSGLTAAELLERSGQSSAIPIDVAQICYDLGIRLKPFDFSKIEEELEADKKGEILGAVIAHNDDLAILYRESDKTNRKRFTIAHELAHSCLHLPAEEPHPHIEFRNDSTSCDKKEIEANIFAGELLIPERSLRSLIGSSVYITDKDLSSLAGIFIVSENVMKARLNELKIKTI